MKKWNVLMLFAGMLALGVSNAYAVPAIDGMITVAGEWADSGYAYYLQVSDPDETDNRFNNMDIENVVLLQDLSGDPSTDGIYLLIETFDTPSLKRVPTGNGVFSAAQPMIQLSSDFEGDGFDDGFNIFFRHSNTNFTGTAAPASDELVFCFGDAATCLANNATYAPALSGTEFQRGSVIEYFFPSGSYGTPLATPLPRKFFGAVTYDNGAQGTNTSDDLVVGQLPSVPEPGTFFLLGAGLLSMLGFGKFGRK